LEGHCKEDTDILLIEMAGLDLPCNSSQSSFPFLCPLERSDIVHFDARICLTRLFGLHWPFAPMNPDFAFVQTAAMPQTRDRQHRDTNRVCEMLKTRNKALCRERGSCQTAPHSDPRTGSNSCLRVVRRVHLSVLHPSHGNHHLSGHDHDRL